MMDEQGSSANGQPNKSRLNWQNTRIDTVSDGEPHGASSNVGKRKLSHLDYTVGWICALEVELSAARLMLDEEHPPLLTPSNDDNCYVLGTIGGHNVAIACLPIGLYGKNSAALVAKAMVSTFMEIDTYVLVGIGGGVPHSNNDIRLGDVVVGVPTPETPAVIQYDFGKTTTEGFEPKGSLDKPRASLLKAVSCLKSSLRFTPSRISDSITVALRKHPSAQQFSYPDIATDILWEQDCEHSLQQEACQCKRMRPAVRQARDDMVPRIFYGPIGSGDQVIKDHYTRNFLARQHGILCFEMEAAGLMDELHALVIRGICDYCDAMKSKEFQPYAALSAAAYAKELLLQIPVKSTRSYHQVIDVLKIAKHREEIMAALKFDALDNRRLNVKKAHSQTCNWLFERQEYLDWIDPKRAGSAFLWLKGKPGSGKSTMMKFLYESVVKDVKEEAKNDIVIASFFDARGTELQKSTLGLYRSLIFQLMFHAQDMQHLLDKFPTDNDFSLNALVDLFTDSVHELGSRQLTCCIDALDECSEDQVREMVGIFEDFAKSIEHRRICLRVAFSSRHYPNIEMNGAKYLVLEALPGHSVDIEKYIQAELRIVNDAQVEDLRQQISKKSSGIFLWVVLVVAILKKQYARGRIHELSKRLAEMPTGLNELFHDILFRDTENLSDLLLCLQWLLYAGRPLTCEELYSAILASNDDTQLGQRPRDITIKQMASLILDCCKGLVEFTGSSMPEVQFIHESVREFLLKPGVLNTLHRDFKFLSADASHERLRDICYLQLCHTDKYIKYYNQHGMANMNWGQCTVIRQEFPLIDYAINHIVNHAKLVANELYTPFLQKFDTNMWKDVISYFGTWHGIDQSFDTHLINMEAFGLLESWWSIAPVNDQDLLEIGTQLVSKRYFHQCKEMLGAYYKSTSRGLVDMEHVDPLLKVLGDLQCFGVEAPICPEDFFRLIVYWHHKRDLTKLNMAVYMAMCCKREAAIRLLVAEGAMLHSEDVVVVVSRKGWKSSIYGDVDMWLKKYRHHIKHNEDNYLGKPPTTELLTDTLACVTFLFDQPSMMGISNHQISTILYHAIEWTNSSIVKALLDAFARWPRTNPSLDLALRWAASCGKAQSTRLLLNRGARPAKTLLHSVLRPAVIQCLLANGVDTECSDDQGNTALHLATNRGAGYTVVILTRQGANTNSRNHLGETPLHCAVKRQRPDIVVRLLRMGAQANATDKEGNTCLHVAAYSGQTSNIKLLVHHAADINRKNDRGYTPFQEIFSRIGLIQSGMLLAAGVLCDHGAKVILPSQKLKANPIMVSSTIRMKLLESYESNGTCCEFNDLSVEQIYFQFCAPLRSTYGLTISRQEVEDISLVPSKRTRLLTSGL